VEPTNLPTPLSSLVGRKQEIADLACLLADHRLLTLTGVGGVGKTRLAHEVGREVREAYEDGVWLVELVPVLDSGLVGAAVATTLNLADGSGRAISQLLIDYLGNRDLLLILDNCEHVVSGCAELVDTLLPRCRGLTVLATSRQPLRVTGEMVWLVPSLSVPRDASAPLSSRAPEDLGVMDYEAVQLFVERARSAARDFALTEQNAAAIARIARQLEGIPLAIELAAARAPILTPHQLAERLAARSSEALPADRSRLPRHQTLEAMADWSHELLSAAERVLFRRLAVFVGGWSLGAAEEVCAGEGIQEGEVLDLLAGLVEKSFVVAWDDGDEKRYRFLEPIREYAKNKLDQAGELAASRDSHLRWFRALAEKAEPELYRMNHGAWSDKLQTEIGNLRAALDWSQTAGDRAEQGLRLAAPLWRFWYARGYTAEAWERLITLLAATSDTRRSGFRRRQSTVARAMALNALGRLGAYLSRIRGTEEATSYQEEGLALSRELGDRAAIGTALRNLGTLAMQRRDYDAAIHFLEESFDLLSTSDAAGVASTALLHLGQVLYLAGQVERAEQVWIQGLELARGFGDRWVIAQVLMLLGRVSLTAGRFDEARHRLQEAIHNQLAIRQVGGVANALEVLAGVAVAEGRPTAGIRLAAAAATMWTSIGLISPLHWREELDHVLATARAALDEEAAAQAWDAGASLTLEEAVEYAQAEIDSELARVTLATGRATTERSQGPSAWAPLTSREAEVASLITQGLTNRDIAGKLMIADGTVGIHVDHILGKLGFHSRALVAAWAAERSLIGVEPI